MKFALVQNLSPSSTGTQDYTDSVISSDLKAALFFASQPSSNNSVVAHSIYSCGAADGTTQRLVGVGATDGSTGGAPAAHNSSSLCAGVSDNNSSTPNVAGAYSSTLSNGIRVNFTTTTIQALINALLIGGSDVECKVVNQTLNTGTSPVTTTVTHGLSGAPDVIFAFGYEGSNKYSHGFWDRASGNYACTAYQFVSGSNPTSLGGYTGSDCIMAQMSTNTVQYRLTIANAGATTFDCVMTGGTIEGDTVTFVCLKITNGIYQVGIRTLPTGTGTFSLLNSDMSAAPKCVLMLMSRIVTVNSGSNSSTAGTLGLGCVVNNNGTTQQAVSVLTNKDNVATTIDKSYTSNTECIAVIDADGAIDIEAAHSSWDAGNVSLNLTNASTAVLIAYLAIAQTPAVSNAGKRFMMMGVG